MLLVFLELAQLQSTKTKLNPKILIEHQEREVPWKTEKFNHPKRRIITLDQILLKVNIIHLLT